MKISRLETHDRFLELKKQSFDIGECCQDLINQRPFGNHSFYIFAHARTDDDGTTKRLIWQPRLSKPFAQTNSMLFKAYPGSDKIKVIWMIPEEHLWPEFQKGNVVENQTIVNSIRDFKYHKEILELPEPDDMTDIEIDKIYTEMKRKSGLSKRVPLIRI